MTVTDEVERVAQCAQCGRTFTPARSDAKYCGASCRQAAHRARLEAAKPKVRRRPLRDLIDSSTWSLDRSTGTLQRSVSRVMETLKDDRLPKYLKKDPTDRRRLVAGLERDAATVREQLAALDALIAELREP